MFYDFKCTKCNHVTTISQSIKETLPKQIECEDCKEKAVYDWSQVKDSINIPDNFKALSGYEKPKYKYPKEYW